ncbi:MAG TPA: acylphosphatase [Planctomycetota bacterium]|nr:acylphosphatase [Planctomycetota bacterium]
MPQARAHVLIGGIVQGVSFRYACQHEAAKYKTITGWVRNTWDGDVEAVFEGEKKEVEAMVAWCHKGPVSADVRKVEIDWQQPAGQFKTFSIRP